MRAVWSFWSKPFHAAQGRRWREPQHHLLAWGLSLRVARQHYPDTLLVTDSAGKALLIDKLGLEFGAVTTELDALRDEDPAWWALGKLYAYSLQERPFVHLDTDVFLWKPLPPAVAAAPVFAQSPEFFDNDSSRAPAQIEAAFARHARALPLEWEWSRSRGAPGFREENCGILGGQRVDFLRHVAASGLALVRDPANAPAWRELPHKDGYNQMVEQFLLSACLDFHRSHPQSPYRGVRVEYVFPDWADAFDPAKVVQAGYTHLLGDAKSNRRVTERLERRMQHEDRDFYRRCQRLGRRMSA